jgi:hypothetical protein
MKKQKNGTPLFALYNRNIKLSGILRLDKVFFKKVMTYQKLRVLNAYGIDKDNINKLQPLDCKIIKIYEADTGTIYSMSFAEFQEKAVLRKIGKFGPRYYLPLEYWQAASVGAAS